MGALSPAFKKKRGGQGALLLPGVLQVPLAQNNPSSKVAYLWGGVFCHPSMYMELYFLG